MDVKFTHTKSGRVFTAREDSRLAKLMAKDEGYKPYAEAEEKPLEKRSVAELKAYAEEQGIELTATKKAEVLAEIQAAESGKDGDDEGGGE
jgi:hypothetical protein